MNWRQLEKQLLTLTAVVEESVQQAIRALSDRDRELAQKVIDNDKQINRLEVDLEEECLKVLALHQPVANDLRMIVAVLKINNDLERIADQAANISERAVAVIDGPKIVSPLEIDQMAVMTIDMLEKALDSLVNADADLARTVLDLDEEVDTLHGRNYELFKAYVIKHPKIDRHGPQLPDHFPLSGADRRPGDQHRRGRDLPQRRDDRQTYSRLIPAEQMFQKPTASSAWAFLLGFITETMTGREELFSAKTSSRHKVAKGFSLAEYFSSRLSSPLRLCVKSLLSVMWYPYLSGEPLS